MRHPGWSSLPIPAWALAACLPAAALGYVLYPADPMPSAPVPKQRAPKKSQPTGSSGAKAATNAPLICIDPGHPSEVSNGTRGKKTSELHVAWGVAQFLAKDLERLGYRVIMTKHREDEMVTNKQRAEIGNENQAVLLIRLHLDDGRGSGFATYFPDRQGTADDGTVGPTEKVLAECKKMAQPFHRAVINDLKGFLGDRGLHTDRDTLVGSQHGGALIGSIYSQIPAILVEMAVLNNPSDEELVDTSDGQQRLAGAIADGVQAALKGGNDSVAPTKL